MNLLAYEFTAAQRRVLDRYARFLATLPSTFNNIPVVFQRRKNSGHQLAVLAADSRLGNVPFNERYVNEFGGRVEQVRLQCIHLNEELALFARESLEITRQTSRNEPVDQVDFRLYSLSRSPTWKLSPPTNVRDLIHELILRFYELRAEVRQLKYTLVELYNESFGLKSVFGSAMAHRTCNCHVQPTVAQELFRESRTEPVWDIAYSSRDASVRAQEYSADIASLFNSFASVCSQMGLFVEELYQRIDNAINELLRAKGVARLGELNFKLAETEEGVSECQAMFDHLGGWLRK